MHGWCSYDSCVVSHLRERSKSQSFEMCFKHVSNAFQTSLKWAFQISFERVWSTFQMVFIWKHIENRFRSIWITFETPLKLVWNAVWNARLKLVWNAFQMIDFCYAPLCTSIYWFFFCSLQEELAFTYEMLSLFEEALIQYDELDALFTQFVVNHAAGGKAIHHFSLLSALHCRFCEHGGPNS